MYNFDSSLINKNTKQKEEINSLTEIKSTDSEKIFDSENYVSNSLFENNISDPENFEQLSQIGNTEFSNEDKNIPNKKEIEDTKKEFLEYDRKINDILMKMEELRQDEPSRYNYENESDYLNAYKAWNNKMNKLEKEYQKLYPKSIELKNKLNKMNSEYSKDNIPSAQNETTVNPTNEDDKQTSQNDKTVFDFSPKKQVATREETNNKARDYLSQEYDMKQLLQTQYKCKIGKDGTIDFSGIYKSKKDKNEIARQVTEIIDKINGLKYEEANYIKENSSPLRENSQIAGVKKGSAMNFEEANNSRVNPRYKSKRNIQYTQNCQSCVVTYEARRRGYNVQAKGKSDFDKTKQLSQHHSWAYINPKTNEVCEDEPLSFKNSDDLYNKFNEKIKPNERYHFCYEWNYLNYTGGHIVSIERNDKNELQIYDPQTGKKYKGKNNIKWFIQMSHINSASVLRVDDKPFNEYFIHDIMTEC